MIKQYTSSQLKEIAESFFTELTHAAEGQHSSIPFIKHTLPHTSSVKAGEQFQVMVIGGTTFHTALVHKTETDIHMGPIQSRPLPVFITGDELCELVASQLAPSVQYLALNFAYHIKPIVRNNHLDGILQTGSKEHTFTHLIGKTVGAELEHYIHEKKNRTIHISLANDSICLLLSGLTKKPWDKTAAGIVGTGTNFAIFLNQQTAVNLESANFNRFPQTQEGKEVDRQSADPGAALFEKEVSGAYLYKLCNVYISHNAIKHPPLTSSTDLSMLIHSKSTMSTIATDLLRRSASLAATQIAGITKFYGHPVTFCMEGSIFWQADKYKDYITDTLHELGMHESIEIMQIEQSTLLGATFLL